MKFTVLGMGKTGHTVCAYLLQQGQTVTAWDRDAQKLAVLEQSGIRVSGALEGHFPIHTESSLADAVADSKYIILVMTTADGHKPVAERLQGLLQPGQRIIVFNCNWGAYEFDQVLHDELREKQILVGETGGMLLLSNLSWTGGVLPALYQKENVARSDPGGGKRTACGGAAPGVSAVPACGVGL